MTPASSLHVAHIGFFNDPAGRAPQELLRAWPTLVDVAEAASGAGVRVSVVQACVHREELAQNGVRYHFLPFGVEARHGGLAALATLIRELAVDVLHVHGLGFSREVLALATLVPELPLVLQDHASTLPPVWRRAPWRRAFALARGIAFCAAAQATPFARAGLLAPQTRIHAIPESTSRFSPGDPAQARRDTGIEGEPALLWVGHLDPNKDPLTVLDGVSAAAATLPGLRLWCCFGVAPLRSQVERRVAGDARLRERVRLLGRVAHGRVEQLMRAADLFVLGSHREGSGYALIEALACGLPPVVTDIPSFRALTGAGAVGSLWPCGDAPALGAALAAAAQQTRRAVRSAVRAHFERELSFAALGAKLAAMYESALERSGRTAAAALPLHGALR
jgi:glycosyltransferase involved in cell wall biosynthesis